jgi:hypothetical protein
VYRGALPSEPVIILDAGTTTLERCRPRGPGVVPG